MSSLRIFPTDAPGIAMTAATTATTPVLLPVAGNHLRLVNEGSVAAYICVASASTSATLPGSTASRGSCFIAPGDDQIFAIPYSEVLYISAITRSSTAIVTAYVGNAG